MVADLSEFPVDTWKRLTARRIRRDGASVMGYGDPAGEPALRAAIARYLAQSRGVRCTMEQIIVLTSSQQALHLVATMVTDPADVVWMEEPGYRGARTALAAMGAPPPRGSVVVAPGVSRLFAARPRFDGWLLGFAALRNEEIIEGVRRLATLRVPGTLRA